MYLVRYIMEGPRDKVEDASSTSSPQFWDERPATDDGPMSATFT
jgi:hypothetical protein